MLVLYSSSGGLVMNLIKRQMEHVSVWFIPTQNSTESVDFN